MCRRGVAVDHLEVPLKQTKWEKAQIFEGVAKAFFDLTGAWPSNEVLAIMWAKFTHECGREGKSCWNHNVGNVRGTYGGVYTKLAGAWERRADGTVYYPENQRFRAYPDFETGIADCLGVLALQSNFKAAWAVLTGDEPTPEKYVVAAKAGRYFTAALAEYLTPVVSLYNECMRNTQPEEWPIEPAPVTRPSPMPSAIPQAVDFVATLADKDKA
jgi:hypothetical protein